MDDTERARLAALRAQFAQQAAARQAQADATGDPAHAADAATHRGAVTQLDALLAEPDSAPEAPEAG